MYGNGGTSNAISFRTIKRLYRVYGSRARKTKKILHVRQVLWIRYRGNLRATVESAPEKYVVEPARREITCSSTGGILKMYILSKIRKLERRRYNIRHTHYGIKSCILSYVPGKKGVFETGNEFERNDPLRTPTLTNIYYIKITFKHFQLFWKCTSCTSWKKSDLRLALGT